MHVLVNAPNLTAAELAGLHSWSGAKRLYLDWHFGRAVRRAARAIVQTPIMAERLARRYGVPEGRISWIGQPATVAFPLNEPPRAVLGRSDGWLTLLFLAAHYAHKNHGILPAVARELRQRRLADRVRVVVTLDEAEPASAEVRRRLAEETDVISNVGRLTRAAAAWREADALFLPTLVESYGLTYVEAVTARRPVLTSDRDFARWMCGDLALYFDPLDPASIAGAIERFVALRDGAPPTAAEAALADDARFDATARMLLDRFPGDWDAVARAFMDVVTDAVAGERRATLMAAGSG